MKKIFNIIAVFGFILATASCNKDEFNRSEIDKSELVGNWVKIVDSIDMDSVDISTLKQLQFQDGGMVKVINGNFCNFKTESKTAESTYEYYNETSTENSGSYKMIKFAACGGGMQVSIQDSSMTLGFTSDPAGSEKYRKLPADIDEPEIPEIPTDSTETEQ